MSTPALEYAVDYNSHQLSYISVDGNNDRTHLICMWKCVAKILNEQMFDVFPISSEQSLKRENSSFDIKAAKILLFY